MKRWAEFVVLLVMVGGAVGAGVANARIHARPRSAAEPQPGDWSTSGPGFGNVKLQVQRVKTETQIDDGARVTTTHDAYLQLIFDFDSRVTGGCRADFRDVRIESDGDYRVQRDQWILEGEVRDRTTIGVELLSIARPHQDCPGLPPRELHPMGSRTRR